MTDDAFEDILDQIHSLFPSRHDRFARADYDKAVALVVNTGGEEQCARLQEFLDGLQDEGREDDGEDPDDDAPEQDAPVSDKPWSPIDARPS